MTVQEKLITADELLAMPGYEKGYELVEGEVVKMAPSGTAHMVVSNWLSYLLTSHVEQHDLGLVTAAEGGYLLATEPDTVRAPDVGFIAKTRLPTPLPVGYFPGAPDLAVEVVSPNDRASDIHDKVMDFLAAGTRLVWVVYPNSKTVTVHQPSAGSTVYRLADSLDGGDVLPGLKLPVRDVFAKLVEP